MKYESIFKGSYLFFRFILVIEKKLGSILVFYYLISMYKVLSLNCDILL